MRQIRQEDLIKADTKFVPSKPCELCGQPTRWAAVRCPSCLESIYLAEELAYTGDWLRAHPDTIVELGHDHHRLVHLVFLRANVRDLGWCGERVSQMRTKRPKVPLGLLFPPELEICVRCRKIHGGMGL